MASKRETSPTRSPSHEETKHGASSSSASATVAPPQDHSHSFAQVQVQAPVPRSGSRVRVDPTALFQQFWTGLGTTSRDLQPLTETPHYDFARAYLEYGDTDEKKAAWATAWRDYDEYTQWEGYGWQGTTHNGAHNPVVYAQNIAQFERGLDLKSQQIRARPVNVNGQIAYMVTDGMHRASYAAARRMSSIPITVDGDYDPRLRQAVRLDRAWVRATVRQIRAAEAAAARNQSAPSSSSSGK